MLDFSQWWFSLIDVIGMLRDEGDYEKNRNYWKYLRAKLKSENHRLGSGTTQLKIMAPDGKMRLSNVLDHEEVLELARQFPSKKANRFIEWFISGPATIDNKSKAKAYQLFGSSLLDAMEAGTTKSLQQIHAFLFEGLYEFAGQIRKVNIAKGGFRFASAEFLDRTLDKIGAMSQESFDDIVDKYVEMNIAHPFLEGNGRSMRIWLDLILRKELKRCVDWSQVDKYDYLSAMRQSVTDTSRIRDLLYSAMTDRIDDRDMFMKGIDYSYYYEEEGSYPPSDNPL